jgi:dimethylglycine catabolism B
MKRPDERAFVRLPVLAEQATTLEKCVFCPKLCRSACPVSNAEPRETLTPWGKMSMAYFMARGDVPLEKDFAATAWACTGCKACAKTCEHDNDVAGTLHKTRAELFTRGYAPEGANEVAAGFREHQASYAARTAAHQKANAKTALVVGCAYGEAETADAVAAAEALLGEPVTAISQCCGRPLRSAGDERAFQENAAAFVRNIAPYTRVVVVDAGCAETLMRHYPVPVRSELLLQVAHRQLPRLRPLPDVGESGLRFHDPCSLGRGLGVYEAPRDVLTRLAGLAPGEFMASRDRAACSGGGALLPVTMPAVAAHIAETRVKEHEAEGGGTIVTACGSSLRMFRKAGAKAVDLVTLLRRATDEPLP